MTFLTSPGCNCCDTGCVGFDDDYTGDITLGQTWREYYYGFNEYPECDDCTSVATSFVLTYADPQPATDLFGNNNYCLWEGTSSGDYCDTPIDFKLWVYDDGSFLYLRLFVYWTTANCGASSSLEATKLLTTGTAGATLNTSTSLTLSSPGFCSECQADGSATLIA